MQLIKGRTIILSLIFLCLCYHVASAAITDLTGCLSTETGGIITTGDKWGGGPVSIYWNIYPENGYFHYEYQMNVPIGEISNFLLGVSENFTSGDIFNITPLAGSFGSISIDWFGSGGNSAPGIPEEIYAVKFDDVTGLIFGVAFDSTRIPVPQDFYMKDGGENAAWNVGFTSPDFDPPSLDGYHIMGPNTFIPEPATIALLGLGSIVLLRRRMRK